MKRNQQTARGRTRAGFSVVEIVVSISALAIITVLLTRAIVAVERSGRGAERRDYASRELENMLAEFTAQPWDEVTAEAADDFAPPEAVRAVLPQAKLTTTVDEPDDGTKRVQMRLAYGPQTAPRPLVLTRWVYRPQEEE